MRFKLDHTLRILDHHVHLLRVIGFRVHIRTLFQSYTQVTHIVMQSILLPLASEEGKSHRTYN